MKLIPTSQWVYGLFAVRYWTDETCTKQIGETLFAVSADERHLETDVQERWPGVPRFASDPNSPAQWATWDLIKDKVPTPAVVGTLYGMQLHESSWAAGEAMIRNDPTLKDLVCQTKNNEK